MVVNLFPHLTYSMTEIGQHGVDMLEQSKKAPQRRLDGIVKDNCINKINNG